MTMKELVERLQSHPLYQNGHADDVRVIVTVTADLMWSSDVSLDFEEDTLFDSGYGVVLVLYGH